jgi:hypothetical protein
VSKCNCSSQKPLPELEPGTSGFVVLTSDHLNQPAVTRINVDLTLWIRGVPMQGGQSFNLV